MQERRREEIGAESAHRARLVATGVVTVLADQISKVWAVRALSGGRRIGLVPDVLELDLVTNPGSAFGLFPGATLVISILATAILFVVARWAWQASEHPLIFGLVLGGGLSNLIDRLLRPPGLGKGEVIDFIELSFWPTFNLADSAIVAGVALLILLSWTERAQK